MPIDPASFPGVFINEATSADHTVTGTATSITAFIGRALRGPVNEPVTIQSFSDFVSAFGGLGLDYPMSYAVNDFYLNGGSQAVIVRVFKPHAPAQVIFASVILGLKLQAASPGKWGNYLRVRIDTDGITQQVADRFDLQVSDLFNLTVHDTKTAKTERFLNLNVEDNPNRVDRVLAEQSALLSVAEGSPLVKPPSNPGPIDPAWNDDNSSTGLAGGSDSDPLDADTYIGSQDGKTGLFALEETDLFNLLCIPPDTRGGDVPPGVYAAALTYCGTRRAFLIVDSPAGWKDARTAGDQFAGLNLDGPDGRNGGLFFPRVKKEDPLQIGQIDTFAACGLIAGAMARTDSARGVWKAAAGISDGALAGVTGLGVLLTDDENGMLNPMGINCLRLFPSIGPLIWGARTLRGADQLDDPFKYIPVRRLTLFIEESLDRGLKWTVFEPNAQALWAEVRLVVSSFMQNLFAQGALQGITPKDAFFVNVDQTTTTPIDIEMGILNVMIGFAPIKPAEFVIIRLQLMAAESGQ